MKYKGLHIALAIRREFKIMAEKIDARALLTEFTNGLGAYSKAGYEKNLGAFMNLLQVNGAPGALDAKTKELIQLGIGISIRCVYCIVFHTYNAYKAGATKAEILDVIGCAINMGGGPSAAYSSTYALAAADEFEHDFD